ncbi:autotransporter translocation and assembly factor TamB [Desulfosalsimonas propionicica]|uniref:Autotransporter translocation and assembly factor TamB n=1 Tax=Desulfosalsimonas propionicica TaxID=332175 RepID=A0A7W0C6M3_9BACT|nr:translocation/assembly module TamB domain-containing protein [Desulfosalsimonas propionicica]MBA2880155.1 autotransporter translocation and assembly factor TamB [Desulfosalsimonas propionicica]
MIRRLLKILTITAAAAAVLAAAAVIAAQVFLGTDTAGAMIRKYVNAAIPGKVHWESQEVSVLTGSVRVRGIEILDPDARPVITAEEVFVDMGLTKLFSGLILVETATVRNPGIFAETGADQRLNIVSAFVSPGDKAAPETPPEKTGARQWNVRINELAAQDGTFRLQTREPDQPPDVFFENFTISARDADIAGQSGSLRFSIRDGRINTAGINAPINRFVLEATLSEDLLDPLELELQSAKSQISVSGSVAGLFSEPVPKLQIQALADLSEIREILGLDPEFSGQIRLSAQAKGKIRNPDVLLELDSDGCRLPGVDLGKIAVRAEMRDRQVDISRLETGIYQGLVSASGTLNLKKAFPRGLTTPPFEPGAMTADLAVTVSDLLLSAIPGMNSFQGNVSGRIDLNSTAILPKNLIADMDAQLKAGGIAFNSHTTGPDVKISARGRMKKGVVHLRSMKAESADFSLEGSGAYDIFQNSLDFQTRAEISGPGRLAAQFGVDGVTGKSVTLAADISGHAARPAVDAEITAHGPGFMDAAVDRIEAKAEFSQGRLELSRMQVESLSSRAEITGRIQLLDPETFLPEPDPALDLSVRTNQVQISGFFPQVSGLAQVSADISGSLKNPEGRITASARDIQTPVQDLHAIELQSEIQGRQINIAPLEIFVTPQQSLQARGRISMNRKYELQIGSDAIDLAALNLLSDMDIQGKAQISAQGAGTLDAPGMDARISLSDLTAEGRKIPDMEISAGLTDSKASFNISEPFALKGRYALSTRDFSAQAQFSGTRLAPFFRLAGMDGFSGAVTGSLRAEGNAADIENARADLNLSDIELIFHEKQILSAAGLTASLENRQITLPENRITLFQEGFLTIRGTGGLDRNMRITAQGVLPAKVATQLYPEFEAPEGQARLSAEISGSIGDPEIFAEINLQDAGFAISQTAQRVHSLNGRIRLTQNALTVSGLSGRINQGEFSVNATAELDNYAPIRTNVDIRARALPVEVPGTLDLKLNADLNFSGTPDQAALTGDVVLLEGIYYKDFNLSLLHAAGELGKRRRQSPVRSRMPDMDAAFVKNLSFDISLGHRNPFMVDNNVALLTVRPQLSLGGSLKNPVLTGRAEVTQGTVSYRNTEFDVQKGVIDFVDPYRIEPEVDIRAEAEVRQWIIVLTITGTPENLDFALSSTPPEEDEDIISLLATGRTTREIGSGSGGAASPDQMLARLVTGPLENRLRRGTGLDIVEVEYRRNATEAEESEQMQVTLGKELSRRLTVKYGVERKSGELVQQSTGIYKLLENLSVNAFQDTEGDFGGEMRYRLEFR